MRKAFSILFLAFCVSGLSSQEKNNFYIYGGIGSHEALHAGIKFNYSERRSILLSYGSFFNMVRNESFWENIALEHDWILHKWKRKDELSNYAFNNKLIYWELNDHYYKFKVISFEPAIARKFGFSGNRYFECDFGPVFMLVLYFKRLTFQEVGWPNYVMLNASIRYNFKL